MLVNCHHTSAGMSSGAVLPTCSPRRLISQNAMTYPGLYLKLASSVHDILFLLTLLSWLSDFGNGLLLALRKAIASRECWFSPDVCLSIFKSCLFLLSEFLGFAWASPSCHKAKAVDTNNRKVAGLSQGHIERRSHTHAHLQPNLEICQTSLFLHWVRNLENSCRHRAGIEPATSFFVRRQH